MRVSPARVSLRIVSVMKSLDGSLGVGNEEVVWWLELCWLGSAIGLIMVYFLVSIAGNISLSIHCK